MLKIIFAVAVLMPRGPMIGQIEEATRFKTEAECIEFGKLMSPRVADWVRGRHQADWDFPVSVHYRCETDGDPA